MHPYSTFIINANHLWQYREIAAAKEFAEVLAASFDNRQFKMPLGYAHVRNYLLVDCVRIEVQLRKCMLRGRAIHRISHRFAKAHAGL